MRKKLSERSVKAVAALGRRGFSGRAAQAVLRRLGEARCLSTVYRVWRRDMINPWHYRHGLSSQAKQDVEVLLLPLVKRRRASA